MSDARTRSPAPRTTIPRWVQLGVLPIALLALWALARAAGVVLVILIVAALIALILNPLVALVQRSRLPRGLAVFVVYVAFFITLAALGLLLANPISDQVRAFTHDVPHIVHEANKLIANLQRYLHRRGIHLQLVKQGSTAIQTLGQKVSRSGGSIVSFGGGLLTHLVTAGIEVVAVFVLSIYMLVYGERIGALVRRLMPPGDGTPEDDYPLLVQHAVSRYVGGQILFSVVMGATAGLALYIFGLVGIFPAGRSYAVVFGIFYGLMELVPYIGPFLGAIPAVLVALFTEPLAAVWVALLFVAIQQLEGHIVAPQIFGHSLRINPLLVIIALLLGEHFDGLLGALLALPVLSVLRETALYLSKHVKFEPWNRSSGGVL